MGKKNITEKHEELTDVGGSSEVVVRAFTAALGKSSTVSKISDERQWEEKCRKKRTCSVGDSGDRRTRTKGYEKKRLRPSSGGGENDSTAST
jgi:hypothetical protein